MISQIRGKMTAEEIREIAIDSSKAYYEYLDQNNKGIQEVDVFELEYLQGKDTVIKLRLSSKLFDLETIRFKILRNDTKYDTISVKVLEYDNDKNILLIKPSEEVKTDFIGLRNIDIKVISDLKFLVERVKVWYELNGGKIALPTKVSKYSNDFHNIQFFKDRNLQPSENQKQSLQNIFTNPFSYVWGAPGTGKTQFVLSYAALHYIKNGDRIAIIAPTNNALEQVLRGVIKMTDKAGVDRKQILRIGIPSKKFAEAYPEVCEEIGIQKKLAEIDKQIDILERMSNFQNKKHSIDELGSLLSELDKLTELSTKIKTEEDSISEINIEFKKKEIELNLINETHTKLTQQLDKSIAKTNSFFRKIIKAFSGKHTNSERIIAELEPKIFNSRKELEFAKFELGKINNKKLIPEKNIRHAQELALDIINNLIDQTKDFSEINAVVSTLSTDNISKIREDINLILSQTEEKLLVDEHLFSEYKSSGFVNIKYELDNYLSIRNKLTSLSTDERLNSVSVIACTLDGYIYRYLEVMLNVEHIYLDEAGYANIIKALTLFNNKTPISFLGDHKQLPPVCELNDSEIERDTKFDNMFLWAQSAIFLDTLFSNSKDDCKNQYLHNLDFNPINIAKTYLNSTYRFGNSLAQVLSKYVYTDDFISNNPEGETKILYVDAKKSESLRSRTSINEVSEIIKIVGNLKRNGNEDYVILTPYIKQLKLLNQYLPQERNNLKILTVHGSQGREWDTEYITSNRPLYHSQMSHQERAVNLT